VTDTLKAVDPAGDLLETVDREAYRVACAPQAYRVAALRAALAGAPDARAEERDVLDLPELVLTAGGRLCTVPAPQEALRVATPEDLLLAEALPAGDAGAALSPGGR
jgi:2-C-methyl-D-erythritol 4-phosphate cytidylyltransferase